MALTVSVDLNRVRLVDPPDCWADCGIEGTADGGDILHVSVFASANDLVVAKNTLWKQGVELGASSGPRR